MTGRVALLAGASGLVGGCLLRLLLDDPAYDRVVALGRRSLAVGHAKLEALSVDFAALPTVAVTDAFCCLGTTMRLAGSRAAFRQVDHDHVLAFAAAARQGGATRLALVSSVGADPASGTFYLRVKGEAERSVAALGFAGLDVFRPSLLLGPRQGRRPAEAVAQAVMPLLNPLLPTRYRALDHRLVARAMLAAMRLPPAHRVHHVADIPRLATA